MDEHTQVSEERGLPLDHALVDKGDQEVAHRAIAVVVVGLLVVAGIAIAHAVLGAPWWAYALLVIPIALVLWLGRGMATWAAWAIPQLNLPSSDDLRLGAHIVVRFRRAARRRIDISDLTLSAWLTAEETIEDVSGQVSAVEVYRCEAEVVLLNLVGQIVEADLGLSIPLADAPASFSLGPYGVSWYLKVDIVVPNAPDDESVFPLTVAPLVAQRLQSGGSGR
jgi:hypothetical protein